MPDKPHTSPDDTRRERDLIESARRQVHSGKTLDDLSGPSAQEFAKVVLRSKLLDRAALKEQLTALVKRTHNRSPSGRRFAKWLLEAGLLTTYQAERLLAGRSEGFFLGDCKVLGVLGAGGMGKVYLAEQMRLGRQVAVKVLPSHRADDPQARTRFLREARAAAELKHPNIVQIHDVGETEGTLYIIMEFVRGESLAERLKQHGPFSIGESSSIIRQVATGLEHAHEHGIIHRDIKPSNLVLEGQTVKILDLGLARKFDADDSITQDGSGLGTPDYMSPEQFVDAHKADARSDLYSLGCTWFHLLTGRPPFAGSSSVQKGLCHLNEPPPSVQSLTPSVPEDVAAMISKLMAKNPHDRYQTPREVLAGLSDCGATEPRIAATQNWPLPGNETPADETTPRPTVGTPELMPTIITPAPADEASSETLVTAPSTSIPTFLLYLIPVMAALVLGGAYFGIKQLLDKQQSAEPLIVRLSESGSGGQQPAPADEPRQSDVDGNQVNDNERDQHSIPHVASPVSNAVEPPAVAPEPLLATNVEKTLADPTPVVAARPAKTWRFANVQEWLEATENLKDGDRIELTGSRPYDLWGSEILLTAQRITLAAAVEAHTRPIVRWKLPGDRRITDGLIQVVQGRLVIEGIDFYVDLNDQNTTDAEMVLFSLNQSDLHLVNCSVTVLKTSRQPVTVALLNGERPWNPQRKGDPPAPVLLELRNTMVRAAAIVVTMNSRQARVSIENSIVCGRGGLAHVIHTRPMEFAHHGIQLNVENSVLDVSDYIVSVDCRPFDVRPTLLETKVESSLLMGPYDGNRPALVTWSSPIATETVSTAIRWSGYENHFFQWGDGLTVKTPAGPVLTLVQSPDDWRLQGLGDSVGWKSDARLRPLRTPQEQRMPDDYSVAESIGVDLKAIAQPNRRLRR